ncbi:VrrA/YqfQ family protein [Cytobacillus purgationiresistens]|uniref:YqfQ-like protein n=1 Tax=Cytobacillus purgationiresistens TaxID=863449 RepID=A0ABU0ADZ5_9BACI|nr:VrrA/YqfQ family protein [Cytobacillus purgationiresistens]MDQ0269474.1 hypothetical protein [Cytobacillus purgationiresistens]
MFPGPRPPFQGGMPPNQFMNLMQGRPQAGGGMMRNAPMPRAGGAAGGARGGGLLSRILGGGSQARGAAGAASSLGSRAIGGAGSSGSGILQTLTNPGAINGFLSNTQKFLNTAGQIGPMVQQYGPMVRNIPSMWKLYRSLKNMPDADVTEDTTEEKSKTSKSKKPKEKKLAIKSESETQTVNEKPKRAKSPNKGESAPKLYI